jgi:hypothetical protein
MHCSAFSSLPIVTLEKLRYRRCWNRETYPFSQLVVPEYKSPNKSEFYLAEVGWIQSSTNPTPLLTGAADGPSDLWEPSNDAEDSIPFAVAENATAANKGSGEDVGKGGTLAKPSMLGSFMKN